MQSRAWLLVAAVMAGTAMGCRSQYAEAALPPPPPPIPAPALMQMAQHNGFETGRGDGERAAWAGAPYAPQTTRAYYDTPGYDGRLGPFDVYQHTFRMAYLHGFDRGFHQEVSERR